MKYLGIVLEMIAFLLFSGWMLTHGHPLAGGVALVAAIACAYTFSEAKKG